MNKSLTPEQKKQIKWAAQNLRLEDYEPSDESKKDAELILLGQKTVEQAIQETIRRYANV